jgi:hypothetical protein
MAWLAINNNTSNALCREVSKAMQINNNSSMAGLGLFDQKSALAVTMPIATAFKFCFGHRKMGF